MNTKPATKMSWPNSPIDQPKKIKVDLSFTEQQYRALCHGFVPEAMEDKWFIYHEDDWLYFHRSWTDFGIYMCKLIKDQHGVFIKEFEAERNQEKYGNVDDAEDVRVFVTLIAHLLLGIDVQEMGLPPSLDDDVIQQWSTFGNAMFGPKPDWNWPLAEQDDVLENDVGVPYKSVHEIGSNKTMSAAFSPDGKVVAAINNRAAVLIWDVESGKKLHTLGIHKEDRAWSVAFSPDGKTIVTTDGRKNRNFGIIDARSTARIWNIVSGECLQKLEGHASSIRSAVFSSDGKRIVTTSEDHTTRIWDAVSGKELHKLKKHGCYLRSAALSPDGGIMITAHDDDTVSVWDVGSGREMHALQGYLPSGNSDVFSPYSPDGKRIVTADGDNNARIWDADSGKELHRLERHKSTVSFAAFLPDGQRIVTASHGTAHIWDVDSGKELQRLEGHTSEMHSVAFSPNGKKIAIASWDATVRIWDTCTGKGLQWLEGFINGVHTVPFSPDGNKIVTVCRDETARIWTLE